MDLGSQFDEIAGGLRTGDEAAADAVFRRFVHRLIALARARLGEGIRAKVDPEDLVQSVFRSFFSRYANGQFQLDSWDGIWTILTVITVRKCQNKQKHYRALRRDVGREVGLPGERDNSVNVTSRDPTPEQAAMLAETLDEVMRRLTDCQRRILTLHLQGYSMPEISGHLHRTERTVRRVLQYVRDELEEMQTTSG